jgi:hypothetical protein
MLLKEGHEVELAGSGMSLQLLEKEFPQLGSTEIEQKTIRYFSRKWMIPGMLSQLPKLYYNFRQERIFMQVVENMHRFDLLISDHRYGMYSRSIPSIFISHQLQVQAPFFQSSLNRFLHRFINRFHACFIPDLEGNHSLAGELTSTRLLKIPHVYLGFLSHFRGAAKGEGKQITVLLSGPEPSRSRLEQSIINQLQGIEDYEISLIRGTNKPLSKVATNNINPRNIKVFDLLTTIELEAEVDRSRLLVCRSAYSTLMDLKVKGIPAMMIPTPGQTEQEYLAEQNASDPQFLMIKEGELNLPQQLPQALRELKQGEGFQSNWQEVFRKGINSMTNK